MDRSDSVNSVSQLFWFAKVNFEKVKEVMQLLAILFPWVENILVTSVCQLHVRHDLTMV